MIITIFILDQFVKLKQSEQSAISIFAWSKATLRTRKKSVTVYLNIQMQPDVAWCYFAKFVLSEHNF